MLGSEAERVPFFAEEGEEKEISLMATMESSNSVSSRESLYSVESEEEEEEQQRCVDFQVFLSESESDTEKESAPVRHQRDGPDGRGFFFSTRSGRTNPALLCHNRKRRVRKPLGLLASAKPQAMMGPCCHYPVAVEDTYCDRLMDTEGSPLRPVSGQKRLEGSSGRKRSSNTLGGGPNHAYVSQLSARGKKRQRNGETEERESPRSPCWTEKDHLFAQKCWELQGFVRPLMELLRRLRMGRFDRGLSSFQQSVAMDRIQRIIGVLQKPEMGERYLGTLLQVERMLKVWFPHIALKNSCADHTGEAAEKKCEATKQSSTPAESTTRNRQVASPQGSRESPPTEELLQTHLTDSPEEDKPSPPGEGEPLRFLGDWPAMNLTWIHTSPISNPPLGHVGFGQANSTFGQAFLHPGAQPYGVVVFLPNPAAVAPGAFARATSMASVPASLACCHSSAPLPRCQSLPSAVMAGGHPVKGTLGGLSRSLPNLPASSAASEGQKMAAYHCHS
ncbi:circadian-associated transcriptional repressor isoform X1 [Sceloporus undulatus]|uniref:circadian-associated transcriptional repressor isoform X1 n=1 Tax=Sceloporus undulatus TaxID=8520 RepID=UPI001C4C4725|nr:circadian-associated transcriptional repressor isoform X1 [Sceloporus undulatus]